MQESSHGCHSCKLPDWPPEGQVTLPERSGVYNVNPPSMTNSAPVMKRESSLAR